MARRAFWLRVLLIDLVCSALVVAVCWLSGWRVLADYGYALFWAGFLLLLFGFFSRAGSARYAASQFFSYLGSVGIETKSERMQRIYDEVRESRAFFMLLGTAGFLLMLAGRLLALAAGG